MYIDKENKVVARSDYEQGVVQRLSEISLYLLGIKDSLETIAEALESMAPKVPSWCQVPDD